MTKCKPKDTFTMDEIKELCALIIRRCRASERSDKSAQKKLRGKMRNLGFKSSSYGVYDLDLCKFHQLIRNGKLKIDDDDFNS